MFAPSYSDPATARVAAVAAAHGLRLVPAVYTAPTVGGLRSETVTVTPDGAEGPFIVRRIITAAPTALQSAACEVAIQSGGRRLTDGAIRLDDVMSPTLYPGQVAIDLPAPVVVFRGDTVSLSFTDPAANTAAGQCVALVGHHVRRPDGQRADDAADEWARRLRDDGEFYAVGVAPATASKDSVNVSGRMLVQRVGIVATGANTSVLVELGNLTITPPTGATGLVSAPDSRVWLDDVRHIVPSGNRVSITPTGDPARVIVIGRRDTSTVGGHRGRC